MHIVLFYDNNVLIFNTIMQYCVRPMSEYVPIYRSHKHVWRKNIEKLELNVLKRKWKGLFSSCSFLRLDWDFHSHSFSVSPGNFKIIETFLTAISRYWFWDNPFSCSLFFQCSWSSTLGLSFCVQQTKITTNCSYWVIIYANSLPKLGGENLGIMFGDPNGNEVFPSNEFKISLSCTFKGFKMHSWTFLYSYISSSF